MTKLHPELFASGFPASSPILGNSSLYNIYPLAYRIGVPVNVAWSAMILLEILAFILAATYAASNLVPTDLWLVAVTAALLAAFGPYWAPDVANLHFPYYGWAYYWSFAGFSCWRSRKPRANGCRWPRSGPFYPLPPIQSSGCCPACSWLRWSWRRGVAFRSGR